MRVIWSQPAITDLFDIADYYDRIDPELAIDMMNRIESAPVPLIANPWIGPGLDEEPGVRKWRIANTPFLLFYAVEADSLQIRRVRHAASDWLERQV